MVDSPVSWRRPAGYRARTAARARPCYDRDAFRELRHGLACKLPPPACRNLRARQRRTRLVHRVDAARGPAWILPLAARRPIWAAAASADLDRRHERGLLLDAAGPEPCPVRIRTDQDAQHHRL